MFHWLEFFYVGLTEGYESHYISDNALISATAGFSIIFKVSKESKLKFCFWRKQNTKYK